MDELVQWLGVQLDRDRQIAVDAKRVVGDDWVISGEEYGFILSDGDPVAYFEGTGGGTAMSRAAAVHAAEHDPARVLREIDAKRKLLDRWSELQRRIEAETDEAKRGDLALTRHGLDMFVYQLGTVYAGRPGYRDDWRP
ncbi:DUF6221 family protein [Streptomyces griseoluteus]|uniref:DUF6221 family protein n=1 Tax=Streptomyces griseoluteus TaxID=29306 RepID=UPI0033F89E40